ncbi:MAG: 1-deoxy-D-xylulose-5-phosphate synthase [Bacteroidales bacterium]|nr:1-deoxy-D-xylulose-5-phosphate synthase [Bacteroidales bacterium]
MSLIKIMLLLENIHTPEDLRGLPLSKLPLLCEELREFIITETAENPGHLGASLGTIELTVALHYVFHTPEDKLVWDVGHQAYAHKILTGRRGAFHDNRKYHGISGFPRMAESKYDAFGTGHSSTSISATLGMAIAAELDNNLQRHHIAVIGDGSIGGGMAFEAMNQAGTTNANILIVLNDNKIAIDHNVGAVSRHLLSITSSPLYNRFKNKLWHLLTANSKKHSTFARFLGKMGNVIKGFLLHQSNLFQSLGFRYFGPVDGHDVVYLVKILTSLRKIQGPKVLHAITVKGKGLELAEHDQTTYHAPGRFNPDTGEILELPTANEPPKYQTVFGKTILELARADSRVVGITPAMMTGCSLTDMHEVFPDRVFDVGIAEQHAVTFAAGMAANGYIPFCNIYSSFLQRAYDQIIHDVALQNLPVIFCIDRGGLVGEDGATHHGYFDLAFTRMIPNMVIAAPRDERELRDLLYTAYFYRKHPFAIRYPRGKGRIVGNLNPMQPIDIGKGNLLRTGQNMVVISIGHLGNQVSQAIQNMEQEGLPLPAHADIRFLKPLDHDLLHQLAQSYPVWLTVEDGVRKGGLFSAIAEFLQDNGYCNRLHSIALPDRFVEHGAIADLYKEVGFDVDSIEKKIKENMF